MGSIYKRGNIWWVKYFRNGKGIRESSKSYKRKDAVRLLRLREGLIAQGKMPTSIDLKTTFNTLAENFLRDYRINGKKSLARAERSVTLLKGVFDDNTAASITTLRVNAYIDDRKFNGAQNSTINRELAALKRMFNLGARQSPPLVDHVPYIPTLEENNTRKGFFERQDFLALRDALPDYLKGMVTFAYRRGWRHSEIARMEWTQVDRNLGIVKLYSEQSKTRKPRTVYLDDELKGVFDRQWALRKNCPRLLPYVFLNRFGTDRLKRFDKAWYKACMDAKIGKRLFHDFRRTAVRNMVRSGISERVAMMISGHKTRCVFDRYDITSERDLIEASGKLESYLSGASGHNLGTVVDLKK